MVRPNGLAFSPDEKYLYVADTGARIRRTARATSAASRSSGGAKLSGGEVFAQSTAGLFDGFRIDRQGRIWTSTRRGRALLRPRRHADRQDPRSPKWSPTSPSAAPSSTACSFAERRRSIRSTSQRTARSLVENVWRRTSLASPTPDPPASGRGRRPSVASRRFFLPLPLCGEVGWGNPTRSPPRPGRAAAPG